MTIFEYGGRCDCAKVTCLHDQVPEAPWLGRDPGGRLRSNALPETQEQTAAPVQSLPVICPGCRWGEGVDTALHVQFLEPDRTAFQFPWPWRKPRMNDRKQLLLAW